MHFKLANTFTTELPADNNSSNSRRQVLGAAYSFVTPRRPSNPEILHVSDDMRATLGLTEHDVASEDFRQIFSGAAIIDNSKPYAMCYGGHQFGHWAGQLGDGRAINLAEIKYQDKRWAMQLKGAGETPYSRTADGLAVLRSSIREHLCSEAMHHLGVPTTRSLSLALTGDQVLRDMLYDGNSAYEKGAVVCRVSPSFIRFGNFEIFASRKDHTTLQKLLDYTIRHFYPHLRPGEPNEYIKFFREVVDRTIDMVIHWQRVGFVHGVMNTDNMSILGLTIDYGPYGWLEGYDSNWTPNTTDARTKRYRFGNQPPIAWWNLVHLAKALLPIIKDAEVLQQILDEFKDRFEDGYRTMMMDKLGLETGSDDNQFIERLETTLHLAETDMTIFFRNLSLFDANISVESSNRDFLEPVLEAFYSTKDLTEEVVESWRSWFKEYQHRIQQSGISSGVRIQRMNSVNPKYVLRNYMAQMAIDKANAGDYSLINEFYQLLKNPYDEQPQADIWFSKRPEWARHKVGCSMLSCSS